MKHRKDEHAIVNENMVKVNGVSMKNLPVEVANENTTLNSQIYTFREPNKNDEYFRSNQASQNNVEVDQNSKHCFVTGYFSPEETKSQVMKNINSGEYVHKIKFKPKIDINNS